MYRKRFQGFKSLEAYRETSKTNNERTSRIDKEKFASGKSMEAQCKYKIYCFFSILSPQPLAQSASTWTTRILCMVM